MTSSYSSSSSLSRKPGLPMPFYKASSLSVDGTLPGLSQYNLSISPYSAGNRAMPSPNSTFKFNFNGMSTSYDSIIDTQKQYQTGESRESVSVTVRFRPLSLREIQKGDEVAWYADGDTIVRSEYNPSTAYAFDKVFGPATTTRSVYDVAAKHVVQGALDGINGTVFAYGVTSSGKTHTMHGDHKSPGIIPLAVKDVFRIIQETPDREFLLRLSYLEIYNEVINDLLNPSGQNLRIREDSQGPYVEGLQEEVVLSPAHALSLIAAGEEHRHVASNNFNLLSSRSHTVFTLTIESSSRESDRYDEYEELRISQLNLIDLAGSESSKTETTGLRMKEGSYINKSLLTLGTVIGKLSEGRAVHVPYRDSKLTRLLQPSLGGNGKVSLICTLTPASSNLEETHNTLKFAQRAKRVTVLATPNRIVDDKVLIRRYQKEIMILREELDQLKRGQIPGLSQEDLLLLRQQLEEGKFKLQSRLEEEEQAKAALLARIQRLTKLILVSTKTNSKFQDVERPSHVKRHSFGDSQSSAWDERKKAFALGYNDDSGLITRSSVSNGECKTDANKTSKRWSMLSWLKTKKNGTADGEVSLNESDTSAATENLESFRSESNQMKLPSPFVQSLLENSQAGELFTSIPHGRKATPTCETMADQMDLLREQLKMLAGEVALCTSSMRRLSENASSNPEDEELQAQMKRTKAEIEEKESQIQALEKQIVKTGQTTLEKASPTEMSEAILKLMSQLNEKDFELEIRAADNRILEEQLHSKSMEIKRLQDLISTLQQQYNDLISEESNNPVIPNGKQYSRVKKKMNGELLQSNGSLQTFSDSMGDYRGDGDYSDSESYSSKGSSWNNIRNGNIQSQMLKQAAEVENLKQEKVHLIEENGGLQVQCQKLSEEASYAKELASAAAVELRNLAEEVTKLSFQNSKLAKDLAMAQEAASSMRKSINFSKIGRVDYHRDSHCYSQNGENDGIYDDIDAWDLDPEDVKRELYARKEREKSLVAALADMELVEEDLRKKLEEAKRKEASLENDLAGMWVQLAKLKKEKGVIDSSVIPDLYNSNASDTSSIDSCASAQKGDPRDTLLSREKPLQTQVAIETLQASLDEEKKKTAELSALVSRLKSEELENLHFTALEELQQVHMEALTRLFQAKAKQQEKLSKNRDLELPAEVYQQEDERNNHICKVCFEAPTAAVLLPCRHFCLCKSCAVACTECPLCRSGIADRIITFTS
uniref:Kinesin 7-Id protein n=1 Tax=Marsilea vestita TaxID=59764 RepID=A0A142KWA1_MARVE|nr:kinesin 7-Id protein [Marsilea vestita]